ncbi:hypothetical protein EMIHUDRAFT_460212 [Emiliania huxleyi CCMP1516]|uniref:Sialate O-acetylesterase domain-containing protein n=2 Tax=Emiliania huxleyi TaxID=2903 RepID=A0A0D3I0Y9_EMIH1|nr:hypothetical protein EMIHUDRAFT_460212 [Emiliania huxleyi CCMP1516]EOD04924.1 hypothetical protein EMIHUDRAFT_460212 [Emiliania huxleyi CCMP1516]|eukprot:XP_005757353.1 hypothetical protein EMIHUDRAFT_460212 [Emiliania huxleyi CCMP1516]
MAARSEGNGPLDEEELRAAVEASGLSPTRCSALAAPLFAELSLSPHLGSVSDVFQVLVVIEDGLLGRAEAVDLSERVHRLLSANRERRDGCGRRRPAGGTTATQGTACSPAVQPSALERLAWAREHKSDADRFERDYAHQLTAGSRLVGLRLQQRPFSALGFASTVWDSSVVLSKAIERWAARGSAGLAGLPSKAVVELGAGCGLVGLTAAALGTDLFYHGCPAWLAVGRNRGGLDAFLAASLGWSSRLADRATELDPLYQLEDVDRPRRLIFALCGQSNMAGRGSLLEAGVAAPPPDARISAFSQEGGEEERWRAGAGPGLSFARELLRRGFAQEVGLVPCACGGSELCHAGETPRRRLSFTGAWDELGSELARWEEGGEWCEAAAAVKRVAASLGEGDTLAGLLWHQGESDCGDESLATSPALGRLRERLGSPTLPVVLGELGYFLDQRDGRFAHAATVNAGTVAAPERLPAAACVSAHGLEHKGDRLHFSTASQHELGRRYALAYLRLVRPKSEAGEITAEAPFAFPTHARGAEAAVAQAIID